MSRAHVRHRQRSERHRQALAPLPVSLENLEYHPLPARYPDTSHGGKWDPDPSNENPSISPAQLRTQLWQDFWERTSDTIHEDVSTSLATHGIPKCPGKQFELVEAAVQWSRVARKRHRIAKLEARQKSVEIDIERLMKKWGDDLAILSTKLALQRKLDMLHSIPGMGSVPGMGSISDLLMACTSSPAGKILKLLEQKPDWSIITEEIVNGNLPDAATLVSNVEMLDATEKGMIEGSWKSFEIEKKIRKLRKRYFPGDKIYRRPRRSVRLAERTNPASVVLQTSVNGCELRYTDLSAYPRVNAVRARPAEGYESIEDYEREPSLAISPEHRNVDEATPLLQGIPRQPSLVDSGYGSGVEEEHAGEPVDCQLPVLRGTPARQPSPVDSGYGSGEDEEYAEEHEEVVLESLMRP
ncbi:hypothetical protein K402DRAFT_391813 [Aulographum hederae CBS 113979]|uniref:Uncharacterized protein n=1 Tax=Aulographum hederae CBS 113979 TaxID=1176131 RepID=A0A6G1H6K0_9PEZI|nr:hypothetical protein K402DRAFT_391813 [Aulographum hederae CBS 113979]